MKVLCIIIWCICGLIQLPIAFTCNIHLLDQKIENRKQEHLETAWILLRSYPKTIESEVNGILELAVSKYATNQCPHPNSNYNILFKCPRQRKPLCGIVPKFWVLSAAFQNDVLVKQPTNNIFQATNRSDIMHLHLKTSKHP